MNMNKRDFAEVLVRYTGIVCCFLAVVRIASFIGGLVTITLIFKDLGHNIAANLSMYRCVSIVGSFILYAGLAYYLTFKGKRVVDFICRD